jgi:hypothetical protein
MNTLNLSFDAKEISRSGFKVVHRTGRSSAARIGIKSLIFYADDLSDNREYTRRISAQYRLFHIGAIESAAPRLSLHKANKESARIINMITSIGTVPLEMIKVKL